MRIRGLPDHGGKLSDCFIITLYSDTILNPFFYSGYKVSIIYVVVLTYVKPPEEVDSQIPEHVEWLKKVTQMVYFWLLEGEFPVMVVS